MYHLSQLTHSFALTEVLQKLETFSKKLFTWFTENEMMANADKCYTFFSALLKITQLKSMDLLLQIDTVKNF